MKKLLHFRIFFVNCTRIFGFVVVARTFNNQQNQQSQSQQVWSVSVCV